MARPAHNRNSGGRPAKAQSWCDVLPVHPAAALFPLIEDPDELRKVGADIKKRGLQVPIALWEAKDGTNYLLDGRNRFDSLEAVGICLIANGEIDWQTIADLGGSEHATRMQYSESWGDDPYALVASLNLHRRHQTAESRRDTIAKLLKATPEKSDRQIAQETKSNRTTVGQIRQKLEKTGDVSIVDTRTDSKGRKQQAHKPSTKSSTRSDSAAESASSPATKDPAASADARLKARHATVAATSRRAEPTSGNDVDPEASAQQRMAEAAAADEQPLQRQQPRIDELHDAHQIGGQVEPTNNYGALLDAWRAATSDEQRRFLTFIGADFVEGPGGGPATAETAETEPAKPPMKH